MAKTTVKAIKTQDVEDVLNVTRDLGDQLNNMFQSTKDLKVAALALSGYKTAIGAGKAQIVYKKLTGSPASIAFFEGKSVVNNNQN
jgi:hypothetical protein